MNRDLTISFTSDIHGYFSNIDYAAGKSAATGLSCCAALFSQGENTLRIDGGDTLQGSPFTYWLFQNPEKGAAIAAEILNLAGYDFVTFGNHDFDYGKSAIETFVSHLHARCLCANVEGIRGVEKTAVVTLPNGLRVGLTGVTSHFVKIWEKPENLAGITITDAFSAAGQSLEALRREDVDVTVCIYHGGFERDVKTGAALSETDENQGYRICRGLGYDIVLTGHQHQPMDGLCLFGSFTCQTPDRARQFVRMDVSVSPDKTVTARSCLIPAGETPQAALAAYLAPLDKENAQYLDTPIGRLDTELTPDSHLDMAKNGSYIANFFNQVQLEASGADLSATSLGNEVKGFARSVTIRDVVATYIFPNTLKTLEVDRTVLKAALERSAEYFALDTDGKLTISDAFLHPIAQHYNFDYISGLDVTADIRRAVGDRIVSIRYRGEELPDGRKLTLCMNNYRATGTGGYPLYAKCPLVRDQPTEIAQLIMEYIARHREITVDKTQWFHVTG